jgi:sulfocyanin
MCGAMTAAALLLSATAPAAAASSSANKWLAVNAARKTVTLTLLAGVNSQGSEMNFNGDGKGKMVVTVPVGWTVDVSFKNVGTIPHSAVIEAWSTSLNSLTPKPAWPGAETPNPVQGTPPGGHAAFHFVANRPGTYRIVCAVPGHAVMGMWDTLVVSKTAKVPAIKG